MLQKHSRNGADPRLNQRREERLFPFERALISLGCIFLGLLIGKLATAFLVL